MADNYGGVDGHLRAQRAVPESQRKKSLEELEKVIKKARAKYAASGSRRDASDLAAAEKVREKYNKMGREDED